MYVYFTIQSTCENRYYKNLRETEILTRSSLDLIMSVRLSGCFNCSNNQYTKLSLYLYLDLDSLINIETPNSPINITNDSYLWKVPSYV